MGTPAVSIGDLLADDNDVYRAFALDGHRRNGKIRARAFYRESQHTDGLSVGLSATAAVAHLTTNHGYCSLRVQKVHALPESLQVRSDPQEAGHGLIHNVPCIDSPDDSERKAAELVAGKLARCAVLVTDKPYIPVREGPEPHPPLS
jgi:hypothetical protein